MNLPSHVINGFTRLSKRTGSRGEKSQLYRAPRLADRDMINEERTALFTRWRQWEASPCQASSKPRKKGYKNAVGCARLPTAQANEQCKASATRAGRVIVKCVRYI